MDQPTIVNVAGKAKHGKDTFADYLADKLYEDYGKKVQKIAFADAVKEKAREIGWDGEKDQNGRALLQFVGTEWGRQQIDKDIWIMKAEKKIHDNTDVVVFTDTRFLNEITYFIMTGYKVMPVKLIRLDENGNEWDNGIDDKLKQHSSETEIDNFPFPQRVKHETLEQLKNQAEIIANGMMTHEI